MSETLHPAVCPRRFGRAQVSGSAWLSVADSTRRGVYCEAQMDTVVTEVHAESFGIAPHGITAAEWASSIGRRRPRETSGRHEGGPQRRVAGGEK